jgi:hypothetical protein
VCARRRDASSSPAARRRDAQVRKENRAEHAPLVQSEYDRLERFVIEAGNLNRDDSVFVA